MDDYSFKRITDPVHKTMGFSSLESEVFSSRAFQRLRNVKQLGLAHYVFPGADYSRFSHALGVCHVTGRILETLQRRGIEITSEEVRLYRLAALLHDVGHYPYSHTMEEAIDDHYKSNLLESSSSTLHSAEGHEAEQTAQFYSHERAGQEVLDTDIELSEILGKYDVQPNDIHSIFTRTDPPRFANLISSDLDADRIDYLLRTAHHTGLPYGSVDLDYLLSQMTVDDQDKICVTPKALRTADHFLLSRYFDYQQVPFHKTVAALELVLKDVLVSLLQEGKVRGSAQDISSKISDGTWYDFDDSMLDQKIKDFSLASNETSIKTKATAIVQRIPPKLIAGVDQISHRQENVSNHRNRKQLLESKVQEWAERFGVDESLWYVWDRPGMPITKIGSHAPISAITAEQEVDPDEGEQSVRVLNTNESSHTSDFITEFSSSLMSVLADNAFYSLRLYVLFPAGKESTATEVARAAKEELPDIRWDYLYS